MVPRPIRRYPRPKYPTRLKVIAQPRLLELHQPSGWRRLPEMGSVLSVLLLANCADSKGQKGVALVAPVFEHGSGRGATGCIVMNPPVFLSEEEALHVIREEMAERGFEMKLSPQGLKGVKTVDILGRSTQEEFSPDLVDAEKHVMVEFLSERDSYGWEAAESREKQPYNPLKPYQPLSFSSSVQSFDFPARASFVNRRVKASATEPFRYATFYDPLGGAEIRKAIWDQREEKLKSLPQDATEERMAVKLEYFGERRAAREQMVDESKRLLRLQVRGFLDWLKAQEAI